LSVTQALLVSPFAEVGIADRPHVGGKGGSLGELTRAGIAVPPGFVVRVSAFDTFIETLEREAPVRAAVAALPRDDLEAITQLSRQLRSRIEAAPLPQALAEAVAGSYHGLAGGEPQAAVAVRSSATTEDAVDASFAGLQDTYLWVEGLPEVLAKVRSCWASLYSVESISYRLQRSLPEAAVSMAVVVQRMVHARTAGVMFTRSPTTGDRSVITIEGAWGLGSAVVGGEVTPDRWVVGKITGEVSVRQISDKAIRHQRAAAGGIEAIPVPQEERQIPSLSDPELQELRALGRQVERHYGHAQDVEWAIGHGSDQILLLQSRPETVWSAREQAPVATVADNPLAHVMTIFGGRR
jgi:pyruvate, water dikinase